MRDDETAMPIPWDGAEEGMIAGDQRIANPWVAPVPKPVGGNPKAYISNRRVVGLDAEDGTIHVYGVSKDGITQRTIANGLNARFVSSAWVSDHRDPELTLLGETITMLESLQRPWSGVDLAIDDSPLLGNGSTGFAQATVDRNRWRCAVTGSMSLPGWADLLLRPSILDYRHEDGRTMLEFSEAVDSARDLPDLQIAMQTDAEPVYVLTIDRLPVSPVLDDVADGAWEQPRHLWVQARAGWLYLPNPAPGAAMPYTVRTESRLCELARAIDPGLQRLRGKLLLDYSGTKTLSVTIENNRIAKLTLRISQPAVVFQLASMAINGASLPFPGCPPHSGAQADLTTVHLVPRTLSGKADAIWKFTLAGDATASLEGAWAPVQSPAHPLFFTRDNDWVLPPGAALNEGTAISALRTLLPKWSRMGAVTCTLAGDEIASVSGFDTISDSATAHGPLARFALLTDGADIHASLCTERWPGAGLAVEETLKHQAAVLRPLYRRLPAELADTLGAVSFQATRVLEPSVAPAVKIQTAPSGRAYVRRRGEKKPVRRTETAGVWPDGYFGWDGGSVFQSHQQVFGDAAPARPAAWDWLEHRPLTIGGPRPDGTGFESRRWIRLSDGSMVDQKLSTVGSIQETVDMFTGPAAEAVKPPEPVNLLRLNLDDSGGLRHLALYETVGVDKSEYSLKVGAEAQPLGGADATVTASASRIVAAWAGRHPATYQLDRGIKTGFLTRVFLELERESGAVRVIRALIGWEITQAFGLEAMGMQVTEIFDTEELKLARKLELNGIIKVPAALGANCQLSIYCWDAVLRRDSDTLPVICNYDITETGALRRKASICALQDAVVMDNFLDLSADIAYFGTDQAGVEGTAAHPWEPERRGLFSFKVGLQPDLYNFKGFIKVRMRPAAADARVNRQPTQMRLIPAWALCDREVVPRFTSGRSAERGRTTWCTQGLLRSKRNPGGGTHLDVQVTHQDNLWDSLLSYGCTLIGETLAGEAVDSGLPVWVPSPVRKPDSVTPAPAVSPQFRLWIFNPHAFAIDTWPGEVLPHEGGNDEAVAIASQTAAAASKARIALLRSGWTREAVLERQPAATETSKVPSWSVVDSPLQNRGASIAWMGWPMARGDRHPADELPLSAQVAQRDPREPDSFSLQVTFEDDGREAAGAAPWPVLYRPSDMPPAPDRLPLGMLSFASRGLRVGVIHRAVQYSDSISTLLVPAPTLRPSKGGQLTLLPSKELPEFVQWGDEAVAPDQVKVDLVAGVLTLTIPAGISGSLRIAGLPSTTVQADGNPLTATTLLTVPAADPDGKIRLVLTVGTDSLPHFAVEHQKDGAWNALSVFPAFTPQLAGIFGTDKALLAFGEGTVVYALHPGTGWIRRFSASIRLPSGIGVSAVMTIDIDGNVITYERTA